MKNWNQFRLIEQIEASVTSVPSNISEGKGRHSNKEFVNFLRFSRGSLNETVTFLNIFARLKWIKENQLNELEADSDEIGKMLNGLINSLNNQ